MINYDKLTECSKCGSDACYTQTISDDVNIELCFGCGFQTNSLMKRDTQFFYEQFEVLPEINKLLMVEEEDTGKIWIPSFMQVEDKGMVFVQGTNYENWEWVGVKSIKVPKNQKDKFKGTKYKADFSSLKGFGKGGFIDALDYTEILYSIKK